MANRLTHERSLYLHQHRENPTDWFPWGAEAFAKAKSEDKPIFLSVGYSSCHWCHVMAHECFEDAEVARLLNEGFVPVKVDREERPDVDETYMAAVQLMSGRGGWPMSVFLTPDLKPFYSGTYFPREDHGMIPGFKTILAKLHASWVIQRSEIVSAAETLAAEIGEALASVGPESDIPFGPDLYRRYVEQLAQNFDPESGGFSGAPKFPPHSASDLLLRYAMAPWADDDLREPCIGMVAFTLEKIVRGGIHDHVGGGFHRYSTDTEWRLPHFEKMLYDNAQMLSNLVHVGIGLQDAAPDLSQLFLDSARGTIHWLRDEMRTDSGLFCAALDADSDGEEGAFYVWTEGEIASIVTNAGFLQAFDIQPDGNFRDEATGRLTGKNVLIIADADPGEFADDLSRLALARRSRPRPVRDDKAIVAWNGLTIGALADASNIEPSALALAEGAALAILSAESRHGGLPHIVYGQDPAGMGFLDDYACFAEALFSLAQATASQPDLASHDAEFWAGHATRITSAMVEAFYDEREGAFWSTRSGDAQPIGRSRPVFDQATPSANAAAIRVLMRLGAMARGRQSAQCVLGWMAKAPLATEALAASLMPLIEPL